MVDPDAGAYQYIAMTSSNFNAMITGILTMIGHVLFL